MSEPETTCSTHGDECPGQVLSGLRMFAEPAQERYTGMTPEQRKKARDKNRGARKARKARRNKR